MSRSVYTRVLPLLFGSAVLLQITSTASALTTSKPDTEDDCLPAIAAKCFGEVGNDIDCQTSDAQRDSPECRGRDVVDMCYTLEDALNCTSDIIDGDCNASEGRLTYDVWLRGFRGVQRHLCANNATNMRAVIQQISCWDPEQFITCLEKDVHVNQFSDLTQVKLDANICGGILRASSRCASQASPAGCGQGSVPSAALQDALSAFLLETPCQAVCWQHPDQQDHLSGAAVPAIVLLALLSVALATALIFVAYRTSCFRIPMTSG